MIKRNLEGMTKNKERIRNEIVKNTGDKKTEKEIIKRQCKF